MTVIGTSISWTNSTWNWATGCNAVSDGCTNCYAKALNDRFNPANMKGLPDTPGRRSMASRAATWRPFEEVTLKLERLAHVRKFKPIVSSDGQRHPHLVFINSVSDWAHDAIPDDVLHTVFDTMEAYPHTIFQCLTKRIVRARKFLVTRYGSRGLPTNIWIGASAEDNTVAARLNVMRSIKGRCGNGTFFVSVEPIVGPTDAINFEGIDWVITGGESGPRARVMERSWLMGAVNAALRQGIPLWHKQSGQILSHPNLDLAPKTLSAPQRFKWLIDNGWERLPEEKGGATIDKSTYRQFPEHYHELTRRLNTQSTLV